MDSPIGANWSAPAFFRPVRLTSVRYAASGINLYELTPVDDEPLQAAEAGAHVDLHLPNGLIRQYSLVNVDQTDRYLIGVKLDPSSRGGSRFIHNDLRLGSVLQISAPRNNFRLDLQARDSVLIAGGIGITPIAAMARKLRSESRKFELHYAVRMPDEACFLPELRPLHLYVDGEHANKRLDVAAIVAAAPPDAHLYCCGPGAMLDAFETAAGKRTDITAHVERFASATAPATSAGYRVRLERSQREVTVPPGSKLLDVLRTAGAAIETSCEQGVCGTCETRVISGVPDHRDCILSEGEKSSNKVMMVCCSGCKSDLLVLDL